MAKNRFNRRQIFQALPWGLLGLGALTRNPAQAAPVQPIAQATRLINAARAQIGVTVLYDPAYVAMAYPNGDVPRDRGVCTDVIIRAYRRGLEIDLQQRVHEDMQQNFSAYPTIWSMKTTDSNIDHRRVPNLQRYFTRQKTHLPFPQDAAVYQPGDLVTMMVNKTLPHIVLITDTLNDTGDKYLCLHNIGEGTREEDVLFTYPITGHYRFSV